MTPIKTSVWWIEYVLANGGELNKSPATNLSWFVYYSLDVLLLLGCIAITAVYGIILLYNICTHRDHRFDSKKRD